MNTTFTDPVEQKIWSTVRAFNDAWTKGKPNDLVLFFHPQMVAITPYDRLRREGAESCIAGWKGFADAALIHRWQEIDPLIRIYGDAAVVTYYYEIDFDMGGQHMKESGRTLLYLVHENSRWWIVADQFSSYPVGQCNP